MSKMSELATTLDNLNEVGKQLVRCGEELIRAVAHVQVCFAPDEQEAPDTGKREEGPELTTSKTYTKEEIRALLADLSQAGFREEAKALVKKYANGGSLTDIDPARYPALAEEAQKFHA